MSILFQHGTLGHLMAGLLEGTATINNILKHGDTGLATLTGSDGEVIFIDGEAYHANEHGEFKHLQGKELTPYATISYFKSDKSFNITNQKSDLLLEKIEKNLLSKNIFSAIKITGTFKSMHVRMMPKQNPPYTRLINSARKQPEKIQENVKGTVLGFYTPELFHGIGASGFHIHFVNDERNFGGHVLDFEVKEALVEIQNFETFQQHFPINNNDFIKKKIDYMNIAEEISEAE